ncbi:hypothetical protein QV06_06225 [Gallibacterium genomosp. 3]|uniref:Uncharacterized protein n=1 Tax=Gallibacterium genomosp. 3 TaxID=505345 RepID=A0A1A7PPK5_9PAST|nr:hypothetical protein [Gallibacterium genomosp. 3]OBX04493.1 hypothetical protein QV06_06225 [Gallibacterium genomosp. 3]
MIFFILGSILAIFFSLNYKKKLILFLLLVTLLIFMKFALELKEGNSYIYDIWVFAGIMYLHLFSTLAFPFMVAFALGKNVVLRAFFTKFFLWFGYGSTIFFLYMAFIKGVIYY